jgi:serine/threonine protein kinase
MFRRRNRRTRLSCGADGRCSVAGWVAHLDKRRDDLLGRRLGDFVLRAQIGEGGFGAVYRCEQPLLGREAVIKVLHERRREQDAAQRRFRREVFLPRVWIIPTPRTSTRSTLSRMMGWPGSRWNSLTGSRSNSG